MIAIEQLHKLRLFITVYYNSLLLCLISTWLSVTLFSVGHVMLAVILLISILIKLIGLVQDNGTLRTIGLVGLNTQWALFTVYFYGYHTPVNLSFRFPLFILLLGVGISLRGQFKDE